LQSLDAFFLFTFGRHFGVLARLQKNVHSAERAIFWFIFPMRKIKHFCCDLERFLEKAQIFKRATLVEQSSAFSSRLRTELNGMLRFGVRFSRCTF